MNTQCTLSCDWQASLQRRARPPQAISRLLRQLGALSRHSLAPTEIAQQTQRVLRRRCCTQVTAAAVSSQAGPAINEEKEAMQAAMAKANAGQASEGKPTTARQENTRDGYTMQYALRIGQSCLNKQVAMFFACRSVQSSQAALHFPARILCD